MINEPVVEIVRNEDAQRGAGWENQNDGGFEKPGNRLRK